MCSADGTNRETSGRSVVSNSKSGQRLGRTGFRGAQPDNASKPQVPQAGQKGRPWLVNHYHAPVYNLILGMLGDSADAADAAQEVFLKAFKGIRSFRQGSSLKTWLYRIAIREALNHRRWFKRHLQKNISIDAEPEDGSAPLDIEDLSATPFDQLASHEIQVAVQSALLQVPDVFRSAVILRVFA